jgi:hypothetical protein
MQHLVTVFSDISNISIFYACNKSSLARENHEKYNWTDVNEVKYEENATSTHNHANQQQTLVTCQNNLQNTKIPKITNV